VKKIIAFIMMASLLFTVGCSSQNETVTSESLSEPESSEPVFTSVVLVPETGDTKRTKEGTAWIDYSNCNEGYVIINYHGDNSKVKLQIYTPEDNTYTYTLNSGDEIFPLTEGNGTYTVTVYENIQGKQYAAALSVCFDVTLRDEFLPFLYPNQYVMFTPDCKTVSDGENAVKDAKTELDAVSCVYNYVIDRLEYDYEKAETVQSGYTPDVDEILASGKGICFDYAAVMATMLRTLGIPAKMDVGWAGDIYHAWISVFIEDIGWINGIIEFDGTDWKLMDPTFADNSNQSKAIMNFINDEHNYEIKYRY